MLLHNRENSKASIVEGAKHRSQPNKKKGRQMGQNLTTQKVCHRGGADTTMTRARRSGQRPDVPLGLLYAVMASRTNGMWSDTSDEQFHSVHVLLGPHTNDADRACSSDIFRVQPNDPTVCLTRHMRRSARPVRRIVSNPPWPWMNAFTRLPDTLFTQGAELEDDPGRQAHFNGELPVWRSFVSSFVQTTQFRVIPVR